MVSLLLCPQADPVPLNSSLPEEAAGVMNHSKYYTVTHMWGYPATEGSEERPQQHSWYPVASGKGTTPKSALAQWAFGGGLRLSCGFLGIVRWVPLGLGMAFLDLSGWIIMSVHECVICTTCTHVHISGVLNVHHIGLFLPLKVRVLGPGGSGEGCLALAAWKQCARGMASPVTNIPL